MKMPGIIEYEPQSGHLQTRPLNFPLTPYFMPSLRNQSAHDRPDELGSTVLRSCALFVRTLEKGAHLRRNLRDFPRCAHFENGAHLRSPCAPSNQGAALDPVPLTRKV